jgi:membrane-bound ClpP family serine protease
MGITLVTILLLISVIFLLLEIFLLPGFSIAGIVGILTMIGAVLYAYIAIGPGAGHITLISGLIFLSVAIWRFMKSKVLDKISLKTDIDSKIEPLKNIEINTGDEGIALSRLAPMGKVKINNHIIEAKVNDDFIDEGEKVVVLQINTTNILVDRTNTINS